MIIGIDVGGTHTDGVLLSKTKEGYQVISTAKVITERENLMNSIISTLDILIAGEKYQKIERLVLSTTLAANAILEGKYDPVGLVLIPGPGLNPEYLKYGEENIILSGYINHRGQQIERLDSGEIITGLEKLKSRDIKNLAVVGKFSIRNPEQEQRVLELINDNNYEFQSVSLGHQLSGRLNFPRRVVTAYYNSATVPIYNDFTMAVKKALQERCIKAEVFILKCDGGTVPLEKSLEVPLETVNSGPAASIMGTMNLNRISQRKETAVVLDIGGTTTDIGLFIDGEPVFMPDGIEINGLPTLIRGLYNVSIPIGGDSQITIEKGRLKIGPERSGPAAAYGGKFPTPTDALLILGHFQKNKNYGKKYDIDAARQALSSLLRDFDPVEDKDSFSNLSSREGIQLNTLAEAVIGQMTDIIANTVINILEKLANQPVYTISELLAGADINPQLLLLMGGPAEALAPILAEKLNYSFELVPYTDVANAVGAALARPTLSTTVRVDTTASYLDIVEAGIHRKLGSVEKYDLESTEELARTWTRKQAGDEKAVVEITDRESFNVIRGFRTLGRIMEVKAQIKPGPIAPIEGSENRCGK